MSKDVINFKVHVLCVELYAPPPNPYVEILTPNVMVSGGGAFQRCLGHEDGTLIMGLVPPLKRPHRASQSFRYGRTGQEVFDPEEGPHLTRLAP